MGRRHHETPHQTSTQTLLPLRYSATGLRGEAPLGLYGGHDPQADVRSDPGTPRMFSGAGVAVDDGPIEAAAQRHLQRGPRRTMRLKGPSSLTTKPSLASDGGGAFFSNLCFTIHSHFGGWLMRPNDTGTQRSLSTLGGNTANDRATSEDETTCRTP